MGAAATIRPAARAALVVLATGLALAAGPARAARPLVTDDAGVPSRGACEAELVAARAGDGVHGWSAGGSCGIADATQLIVTYSRFGDGERRREGLAPTLKTVFADGGSEAVSWAASATLYLLKDSGRGWTHDSLFLNLIATRPLGAGLTGHANLGLLRVRANGQAATTWNLALEHGGTAGLDLVAEVFGDDRSSAPWLAAGLRWNLATNLNLNAAWARQRGAAPGRVLTVGVKTSF